jgi:hypothetical protein
MERIEDFLMAATGTGIASFLGLFHRILVEMILAHMFAGTEFTVWTWKQSRGLLEQAVTAGCVK